MRGDITPFIPVSPLTLIVSERPDQYDVYLDELTLRLLMSYIYIYIYIYGAPSKARNANVVYIWTYVWQRYCCTIFQH